MAARHSSHAGLVPAVAYLRMSDKKQDKSIPAQRDEIERFAAANGFRIVRWYADEGISGAEGDRRAGFQRLIADSQQRKDFAVILLWDQDRFSRFDPMEANYYWYLLRQAGVRIVTVTQGELDFSDLGGWLSASVTQHGKAQYLRDLSRNVLRGRLAKARSGKYQGNRVPYGYLLTHDGDVIVDETAAQIVRLIFERYATQEVSLWDIAHELNTEGAKPPKGAVWKNTSVHCILMRDCYHTGRLAQFQHHKGKFYAVCRGEITPAESIDVKVTEGMEVACPALVDRKLVDCCRANLKHRTKQTSPGRKTGKSLMLGLLYCAHCGERMTALDVPPKTRDPRNRRYHCGTYHRRGKYGCHRNLIHEKAILDYLVPHIQRVVLSAGVINRLQVELRRQIKVRAASQETGSPNLRKRLVELDRDIAAGVKELKRTPDDLYDLAVEDLRKLRKERKAVEARLAAQNAHQRNQLPDEDSQVAAALNQLERLRDALSDADPKVARHALQQLVERVDLWFDHVQGPKITRSVFQRGVVTFRLVESDWPELALLPDVGEQLARRIVEYRAEHGPFRDLDQLKDVRGIGPKTFDGMRPYLLKLPDVEATAGEASSAGDDSKS